MNTSWEWLDCQARLYQCIADMEAMKIDNIMRLDAKLEPAYGEGAFLSIMDNIQCVRDDMKQFLNTDIRTREDN